ncbi:unnamed protein product [Eruca vesicaria subsp. sativa]|uniref:FKB95-like N-terminal Kelch domain-containing protein n=1 Tax=Eruca vesicaria subsp. sativa TaxID=29727 RepID=A0ABC8K9G3_ERUVS|nr:unnamed protein product [Eruca vesicaria subsp. sativa]
MRSACLEGKFHVATNNNKVVCYKRKWDMANTEMSCFWFEDSYCVIENVLYSFEDGTSGWHDTEVNMWKVLEGGLPNLFVSVRFADYGGKMVVPWDQNKFYHVEKMMIWCAVFVLKRPKSGQVGE